MRHNAVFDRILIHVMHSSKPVFMRVNLGIPIVPPHFAPANVVKSVRLERCYGVKPADKEKIGKFDGDSLSATK